MARGRSSNGRATALQAEGSEFKSPRLHVMKLYEDYYWLKVEYVDKKKSAKEIGEYCGVTEMTIWNHLKKANLLKYRGKGRKLGPRVIKKRF